MSDSEELDEIRRRKRDTLERRLSGDDPGDDGSAAAEGSPTTPIHVEGDSHLAEVVADHDVVLVDFYADWCGPCKMLEPTVAALARDSPAAVAKVDVDTNQALASQYGVRGVPTMILFSDGEPVERIVGVRDQSTLASIVAEYAG
ncbi:thioredoxin [Salinigranum sp. GCM10025319]|uniref:thioredoxin n=1 Tax=Salinigranum sp. GCM10025319 TaxID=3252687 RepID=UPI003620BFCA